MVVLLVRVETRATTGVAFCLERQIFLTGGGALR